MNSKGNMFGLKNKGVPKSPEHRKKIAAVQIGRRQSVETREKRRQSMLGKHTGEKNPAWIHDREEAKLRKKIFMMHRGLLGRAMQKVGSKKFLLAVEELGYSPADLRMHIESLFEPGMSWENHGRGEHCWHIDHVRPVCTFPMGTAASEVNALSNLRPLWEKQNLARPKKRWR